MNDLAPKKSNVLTVTLCCCCHLAHETYFNLMSIVIYILLGIPLADAFWLYFKGSGSLFMLLLTCSIDILILTLGALGHIHYCSTKNYGNAFSVCFSLLNVLFAWLIMISIIALNVLVIAFGGTVIHKFYDYDENKTKPITVLLIALVILNAFLLPANLLWLILVSKLHTVTKARKNQEKSVNHPMIESDKEITS